MATIKLDSAGDISFTNGKLDFVYDNDAIAQSLQTRLRHFKGEFFRDENAGTDWFGKILGKQAELVRRAEIVRVALETPGIDRVDSLTFDGNATTRNMEIAMVVIKEDGFPLDIRFKVES